jgi:hypothetical protein
MNQDEEKSGLNDARSDTGWIKIALQKQWNIEIDFCNLKTPMGMDVLSCKIPDMIEKEI